MSICTALDECVSGTHNCHRNASCGDVLNGTFTCSCHQGYVGDGVNCEGQSTSVVRV